MQKNKTERQSRETRQTRKKEILQMVRNINPISRYLMRIGTIIILLLYIKALAAAVSAGFLCDYYEGMFLCCELLFCAKECVGAVYIPALLFELIRILDMRDKQ